MKMLEINGSPWGYESHTHVIAEEFLAGAEQAGAKVETVHLIFKHIKSCNGCSSCFYKSPGQCKYDDDMTELAKMFISSDIVVFCTPVYIDNVTALLKLFIDRLIVLLEPHYEKDIVGEYRRGKRFKKCPEFFVISSSSLPGQDNFEVLKLYFRRMARTFYTEVCGEIYLGDAGLLHLCREDIRFRSAVDGYKKLLREAGREFIEEGFLSSTTRARLRMPLIDAEDYVRYANEMWDKLLDKRGLFKKVLS